MLSFPGRFGNWGRAGGAVALVVGLHWTFQAFVTGRKATSAEQRASKFMVNPTAKVSESDLAAVETTTEAND